MTDNNQSNYAYLPEDLLLQMLNDTPRVVDKLVEFISVNDQQKEAGREELEKNNLIKKISTLDITTDLIAVDGANIIEHMTGSDLLMSIAVGVEGISEKPSSEWSGLGKQHYSWQEALPHHPANSRLTQGIMFLMELSILANSNHEFRIMDGSHITSIMKLNSLLSPNDDELADKAYVNALNSFLDSNYNKIIPDIPQIINDAFKDPRIVGLTKYSSSREILDSKLQHLEIPGDDKTYFNLTLHENEYTSPLPVGQASKERDQWNFIHMKCNLALEITEQEMQDLNTKLKAVLHRFKPTKSPNQSTVSESDLYFFYYKPNEHGICYRIEVKKALAEDEAKLEKFLLSLKNQIFFPEIHEPYPQYLADVIAKNISFGMGALKHAIMSSEKISTNSDISFIMSYRSN
jgi:hypothetical protein